MKPQKVFPNMGIYIPHLLQLLCLIASTFSQEIQVTLYEHTEFKGEARDVTVNTCQNVLFFNDRTSSLKITSGGCLMLYKDHCCQGNLALRLQIQDLRSMPDGFNDQITSLSPCDNYRSTYPDFINETWLGHSQEMRKVLEEGDITIYYNDAVKETALQNHYWQLQRIWRYVKNTYGQFGPEGGRLSAYIHADVKGPTYGFNSIQNYFDIPSNCRNLIDLVSSSPDGWSRNLTGVELDVLIHEIGHIVEGASKGLHGSPSFRLWGDSKWAEIFIYDVYSSLEGTAGERDRWFKEMQTSRENYPRPNTYWFRDWFYPVYTLHGGSKLLNNYFELLAKHFPRRGNRWQYEDRAINLGEFVHFFSGAAGTDLKSQAEIAFKWDEAAETEFQKARNEFSQVKYFELQMKINKTV